MPFFKLTILSMLLTFFNINAEAALPCSSLWSRGFPESGHIENAGICDAFIPLQTILNSRQEMYFQDDSSSLPEVKQLMEWAAAALDYSSAKYQPYSSIPPIKIIFSPRPYHGDSSGNITRAFTYVEFFNLTTESCPIVIYPAAGDLSKEYFYQMIAHEVYHCIQKADFPSQTTWAVTNSSEGLFWYESIAQFMSNEVYPSNDFEYHPMFGTFDGNLPFYEQSSPYLSEGFFQGLFWQLGGSQERMHALQENLGSPSAVESIMTIPRIAEFFHTIARKMSFQELNDSSGALTPWRVNKQIFTVSEAPTSRIDISFADFSTMPFEIIFPKKGQYRIRVSTIPGAKLSVRKLGATEWQNNFENEFTTDCNEDKKIEGIYTRVSSDQSFNTIRIEISRRENSRCPCDLSPGPKDLCLFGSWQVDTESVIAHYQRIFRGRYPNISTTGTVKFTFTPSGQIIWDYQNFQVTGRGLEGSKPISIQLNWNGQTEMDYATSVDTSGPKYCGNITSSHIENNGSMTIGNDTIPVPQPPTEQTGSRSMSYECTSTSFRHIVQPGGMPTVMDWTFHR